MGELKKNEKTKDVVIHTAEEFQKLALSFIPGGPVIDTFLNFRANLKQKRIIAFSGSLKDALENIAGRQLHADDFANEGLIDVMELVMSKVHSTKSIYKLDRFRNILLKQIVAPAELDETIKCIRILDELQDIDLHILSEMRDNDSMQHQSNFVKLLTGSDETLQDDHIIQIEIGGNTVNLIVGDIEFYVNRLTSLGLFKVRTVHMTSSNKRKRSTTKQYQTLLISNMGKRFLNFIERN